MRIDTSSMARTGFFLRPTTNRFVTWSMTSAGTSASLTARATGPDMTSLFTGAFSPTWSGVVGRSRVTAISVLLLHWVEFQSTGPPLSDERGGSFGDGFVVSDE